MTTTTHRRDRGRSSLFHLSSGLVLPLDLPGLPEPIERANADAHRLLGVLRDAQAAEAVARNQAAAAPRHDALALEAALAAGEKDPKPTADAKAKAAESAAQKVEAAENAAKAAVRRLYDAVEDNLDAYRASREGAYAAETTAIAPALRTLVETFGRAQTEAQLVALARDWHNNPNSAALSTATDGTSQFDREFGRALKRRRDAVAAHLAGHGANATIEPKPVPLLAALIVALEAGTSETLPVDLPAEMYGRAAW